MPSANTVTVGTTLTIRSPDYGSIPTTVFSFTKSEFKDFRIYVRKGLESLPYLQVALFHEKKQKQNTSFSTVWLSFFTGDQVITRQSFAMLVYREPRRGLPGAPDPRLNDQVPVPPLTTLHCLSIACTYRFNCQRINIHKTANSLA